MPRNQEKVSVSGITILILVILNVIILKTAFIHDTQIYWGLIISLPLLLIAIFDFIKKERAIQSEIRQLKTPTIPGKQINKTQASQGYHTLWERFRVKTQRHEKKPQE